MAIVKMIEICDKIGSGATPRGGKEAYCEEGTSLVRSQNVLDFNFSKDGLVFINDEQAQKLANVEVHSGDILLNITGDSVARACTMDDKYLPARVNQHVAIIRGNADKVLNNYILYYLHWRKEYLLQLAAAGATRKALTKGMIEQLEIDLPSLDNQKKTVAILDSLQNKIQINQKINDNLQQQANLIFDELVGRLIPTMNDSNCSLQLHEIGSLDILVTDYVANGSFKSLADNVQYLSQETDNVLIRLTDYNNNFSSDMVYISDESYNFLSKSKLYGDEIIISNVGANVGTVFRCPRLEKRMSLAPNAIMLRSDKYEHYLYLYFISHYGQQQLQSIVTGSAQPKFNKTNFRSLKVILPDEATLSKITDMYTPMYEQIVSNLRENKALTEIRDSLLPKLMSGEIDVSAVQL